MINTKNDQIDPILAKILCLIFFVFCFFQKKRKNENSKKLGQFYHVKPISGPISLSY